MHAQMHRLVGGKSKKIMIMAIPQILLLMDFNPFIGQSGVRRNAERVKETIPK